MKRLLLVPGALILGGCSVPPVQFYGSDAAIEAGGVDVEQPDVSTQGDAPQDAVGEAIPETGTDAGIDAPPAPDGGYCYGNAPPAGGKCCPDGGGVCFGSCSAKSCGACMTGGACAAPNVCCTTGANGTCEPSCS
ncbi:MAG TPA: hypothetical protein VIY73_26955 [Polyangiaceae bacterium]